MLRDAREGLFERLQLSVRLGTLTTRVSALAYDLLLNLVERLEMLEQAALFRNEFDGLNALKLLAVADQQVLFGHFFRFLERVCCSLGGLCRGCGLEKCLARLLGILVEVFFRCSRGLGMFNFVLSEPRLHLVGSEWRLADFASSFLRLSQFADNVEALMASRDHRRLKRFTTAVLGRVFCNFLFEISFQRWRGCHS